MALTSKVTLTFSLTAVDVHLTLYLQSSSLPLLLYIVAPKSLVGADASPPASPAAASPACTTEFPSVPPSVRGASVAAPSDADSAEAMPESTSMQMPIDCLISMSFISQCMSRGPGTAAFAFVAGAELPQPQASAPATARTTATTSDGDGMLTREDLDMGRE